MINPQFISQYEGGGFRHLRVFNVTTCIYDITFYFAHHFFEKGDRTIDQMIQAARSGRQNIAEGNKAGVTSKETEIKLTNVAKSSLQELLLDYEDFLRQHELELWDKNDPRCLQVRRFAKNHNQPEDYMPAIKLRKAETICNIAIVLIYQADLMRHNLIERQKTDFLKQGGIREQMTRARLAARSGQDKQK